MNMTRGWPSTLVHWNFNIESTSGDVIHPKQVKMLVRPNPNTNFLYTKNWTIYSTESNRQDIWEIIFF